MNLLCFFLSTFIFAIIFGFLESEVEKDKGWGSGFDPNRWYAKVSPVNKLVPIGDLYGNIPLLNYHIILAFIFFPLIIIFSAYYFQIYNIFYVIASYTITVSAEDFSWFVLNRHMHSLRELFNGPNGKIFWIRDWTRIGTYYIPRQYIFSIITAIVLILLGMKL